MALLLLLLLFVLLTIILIDRCFCSRESFLPFITNPQMANRDRFYLRTLNGAYVSVCYSCKGTNQNLTNQCAANLCVKDEPVATSIFTYETHRDGTFSVKTFDGHYWKRCENCFNRCPNIICADGINSNIQPSKFVLIKNGDNTVSIKTDTGRLLETQDCEQSCGEIIAALGVGANKTFTIEKIQSTTVTPIVKPIVKNTRGVASYAPMIIPFQE